MGTIISCLVVSRIRNSWDRQRKWERVRSLDQHRQAALGPAFDAPQEQTGMGPPPYSDSQGTDDASKAYRYWLSQVRNNGNRLRNAPIELRDDKRFVLEALPRKTNHRARALQFASDALKDDKELVLSFVRHNGSALQHASEALKNDKDTALAALRQNGLALKHVSEPLKSDEDVALAAVRQDGLALKHVSEQLTNDTRIVVDALKKNERALRFAEKSRRIEFKSLLRTGLRQASRELRSDKEVVLMAVARDPSDIKFALGNLKRDRDCLNYAGLFDKNHPDASKRSLGTAKKMALSTRFDLKASSGSEATNFTLCSKPAFVRFSWMAPSWSMRPMLSTNQPAIQLENTPTSATLVVVPLTLAKWRRGSRSVILLMTAVGVTRSVAN